MPKLLYLLPLALTLCGGVALAQDEEADEDAPERVARLSYVQGDVSLQPDGGAETMPAPLNRPLISGDTLWVEQDSRAELQTGGTTIHLDADSSASFVNLMDDELRLSLTAGTASVHVNTLRSGELIEIETPNATVSLLQVGDYRISAARDGEATIVAVRGGESRITRDTQSFTLSRGQQGEFKGTTELLANIGSVERRDDFENWANDRNRREERSVSSRYVSRDVVGYEDLDEHGSWSSEPEYGYVWYPRTVGAGWAPYRYGHWSWIRPWGWTWIDRAPWGFAPFHYGRWAYVRSRWCWVPEPRHIRPRYSPAHVGWVGRGDHVAWFPLGPREKHRYKGSDFRYMNQRAPDAVTMVPRETLTASRPVDRHSVRLGRHEALSLRPNMREPSVTPHPRGTPRDNSRDYRRYKTHDERPADVRRAVPTPRAIPNVNRSERERWMNGLPSRPIRAPERAVQRPLPRTDAPRIPRTEAPRPMPRAESKPTPPPVQQERPHNRHPSSPRQMTR